MADLSKIALGLFIAGFWLLMPLGFSLFGESITNVLEVEPISENNNIFTVFWDGLSMYWQLLTFDIPNLSPYLRYFINFLQISSILFIIVMVKE